ncbi:pentatricopeptide repeat-containing protein At3g61520, mitochondrial [Beta vulgaris subsp. vulgaris]|uniref:pentatricopeptide repeat-containing protein At3g61520, mitochondrial n=1 Tax=Beta vulgaris subsp. vulgaris TaxID=3555 RepID=UPI002036E831|nr:pentatricopeptide repeat-containing protein At3g61520, mitochondrial [Beta vulgaris subsp. vulgaris]
MNITSRAPKYSKLQLLLRHQNPQLQKSFLHLATEKPCIDNNPSKLDSSSSSSPKLAQIVDILKSNNNENWKTNKQLSGLLFSDSHSLSCNDILQITRRLGDSSTAINFVEHLRCNNFPDANSLSFAFQAVFELVIRQPDWKKKLFDLYNTFKELGVPLTVNSATLLIRWCGQEGMIEKSVMFYDGLNAQMKNTHVRNVLIGELFRCGRFHDAFQVLDEMLKPNAIFPPDVNTFGIVFPVLLEAKKGDREMSEEKILELVLNFGRFGLFLDSVMLTKWIVGLCRSRRSDMAWKMLHGFMELDGPVEVASCNALLTGLAKDGQFKKMKSVMEEMQVKGICPNVITLGISINHLCKSLRIDEALNLFEKMRQGKIGAPVEPDVVIYNTLIDGLCKVGRVEEGLALMRKMVLEGKCSPTSVTYNCLIDGFLKDGELERSLELYGEMEKEGVQQNVITVNTLVGGMCRHGNVGSALKFYREVQEKGLKGNKVTYTMLLSGFCGVNNISKAMELFDEIKQTCAPDAKVYYTLINGLSQAGLMDDVESVLLEMRSAGFRPDIGCYNVMINGFCKKNKLDKAHWLMNEMGKVGLKPDGITYNTLISYFSKCGNLETAHRLLKQMVDNKIFPTVVTYGALIHACCSVGKFDDAMKIFRQMRSSTRIPPNTVIYNILIDSLCQKKKMEVALSLFEDMLIKGVSPNSNTFNALFKCLRDENHLEKAFELMEKMTELACHPDYITMEVLTEWLSSVGEADRLRQFVEGYNLPMDTDGL